MQDHRAGPASRARVPVQSAGSEHRFGARRVSKKKKRCVGRIISRTSFREDKQNSQHVACLPLSLSPCRILSCRDQALLLSWASSGSSGQKASCFLCTRGSFLMDIGENNRKCMVVQTCFLPERHTSFCPCQGLSGLSGLSGQRPPPAGQNRASLRRDLSPECFLFSSGDWQERVCLRKNFSLYRNFYLTCQVKMCTPAFISTKHHFFCFPGSSRDGLLPLLQPDSEAAPAESPRLLLLPAATQTLRHRGHRAHDNTKGDNPQTLKTLTAWPMPAQTPVAFTPYSDRIQTVFWPVCLCRIFLPICLSAFLADSRDRSTGQDRPKNTNPAQQTPDTALFPA